MRFFCLLCSIYFFLPPLSAQNLVPNPSFEEAANISNKWSGTFSTFNRNTKLWESPTQGSPDLIFAKVKDSMFPPRKNFDVAPHEPRTGLFMVGLKTYGCQNNNLHCKEYLQIKLSEPLIKGEEYYFEYWVNPLRTGIKVNKLGIALSPQRIKDLGLIGLLPLPYHYESDEIYNAPVNEWKKVSGKFTASESLAYLLIGSFVADEVTLSVKEENGLDYSYYLIDDVLLRPINYRPQVAILSDVAFEFNKSDLSTQAYPVLEEVFAKMKKEESLYLKITGHTSNEGNEEYNLDLSVDRGIAVADYLVKKGIPDERILSRGGVGSQQPLVPNDSEENRRKNRRVEIEFVRK